MTVVARDSENVYKFVTFFFTYYTYYRRVCQPFLCIISNAYIVPAHVLRPLFFANLHPMSEKKSAYTYVLVTFHITHFRAENNRLVVPNIMSRVI